MIVIFYHFMMIINYYHLSLHQITMNNIANIMKNEEKTSASRLQMRLLPMQGYMSSIVSRKERAQLMLTLKGAMGVAAEVTWGRWVVDKTYRPSYAQREAAAEVIRHHSGNEDYTGEVLFPEYLYKN